MSLDFRGLVETVPDAIAVVDRDHRFRFVNAALAGTLGRTPEALLAASIDDTMDAETAAQWRDAIADVLVHGTVRPLACTLDTPHGRRPFSATLWRLDAELVCALVRDVSEQQEAIERAHLADRRKDEFLAMLGHELRNPLAPITTALDLMDFRGGSQVGRERDVIRRQVAHLTRLVDDLLDISRITRGTIQLAREKVELSEVVARAIELASPLLEKRLQRIEIDVARDGLVVHADVARLAQVFHNLLTNASKYSGPRAEITLRARAEADTVQLEVRDHGIGIAPELQPQLFDMFVQGKRTLDRAEGGLGLGLAIARSLCELHGGTISVASDGPGTGSTFTVTLPRVASVARSSPAPTPRWVPRVGTAARVLVVDDNVDAAVMLREMLASVGHELAVAHDGPAALELAASFEPDVAVLDIGLPVMNGYELARLLRERLGEAKGRRLRLIALTGYGQESDRARAQEVGFDHHLVKPIALEALLALLEDPHHQVS